MLLPFIVILIITLFCLWFYVKKTLPYYKTSIDRKSLTIPNINGSIIDAYLSSSRLYQWLPSNSNIVVVSEKLAVVKLESIHYLVTSNIESKIQTWRALNGSASFEIFFFLHHNNGLECSFVIRTRQTIFTLIRSLLSIKTNLNYTKDFYSLQMAIFNFSENDII